MIFRIRSWDTLSNALAKSKYITSTFDLLLIVSVRSYVNGTICVVHDFEFVKPCCLGSMSCSQELNSSFLIHLSKTFIIRDVNEMGLKLSTEPFSSFVYWEN